ncbi:CLUMA_CG006209, isoform A [Clunio marinus]|uniref:CLUMA_CG006209, isoform A n=1 Tax=Clunio marinus TaxID=568069 RepID=A0A1J1HZ99_9DIPT|nr:CLUMA_CG006209, isoform A [Clunio marinus]
MEMTTWHSKVPPKKLFLHNSQFKARNISLIDLLQLLDMYLCKGKQVMENSYKLMNIFNKEIQLFYVK